MEHVKSPVIESSDYYPFGLTFNNYRRENSLTNQIKFQGQEHQDELDLGWDSFKWRNHMPEIGRFFNVDPLAEKYVYNSPYAFSENKVTSFVELEGLEGKSIHEQALDNEVKKVESAVMSVVDKIGSFFSSIGDALKEKDKPAEPNYVAVDEDQKEQVPPTNTELNLDGGGDALYNPNATVESNGNESSNKVVTSSESHQKSTNSTSGGEMTVDSINVGIVIRVNYQFGGNSKDSTRDVFDRVKVGDDTVNVYRLSVDDKNKQVIQKSPKPTLKN